MSGNPDSPNLLRTLLNGEEEAKGEFGLWCTEAINYNGKMPKNTVEDPPSPTSNNIHYHACSSCKKHHKKCDRILPRCTRCLQKGWKCEYQTPSVRSVSVSEPKRRKESKQVATTHHQSVKTMFNNGGNQDGNITEQAMLSLSKKTLEVFFSTISFSASPFKKEDLETIMCMTPTTELSKRKDFLSLMLSIQCLCEQVLGFPDLAEDTMKKTRSMVMQVFDQFDNPFVANTFSNLSLYYASEGDIEKGRGFLKLSDNFTSLYKSKSQKLFDYDWVEKYQINFSVSAMKLRNMLVELMCCETYPIPDIPVLSKIYTIITELDILNEWSQTINYQQNMTDRVDQRFKSLELMATLMEAAFKNLPEKSLQWFYLNRTIFLNGVNVLCLIIDEHDREEKTNYIEYFALAVSNLIGGEMFFLPPYLISFILLATKVNFEVCKMIDRGERENLRPLPKIDTPNNVENMEVIDYYSIVARDLQVLRRLSKCYRYIRPYTLEVEAFINTRAQLWKETSVSELWRSDSPPQSNCSRAEQIGRFYSEMKGFLLKVNKEIGNTILQQTPTSTTEENVTMVTSETIDDSFLDPLMAHFSEEEFASFFNLGSLRPSNN